MVQDDFMPTIDLNKPVKGRKNKTYITEEMIMQSTSIG